LVSLNPSGDATYNCGMRPLLIRPHQARVPGHIGGEDRGEAADGSHRSVGGLLA
jgi:hypothetical protein